jgi:hypothetical protein
MELDIRIKSACFAVMAFLLPDVADLGQAA